MRSPEYNVTDPDDYAHLQDSSLPEPRQQADLDLMPYSEPYRLENWPLDDLIMYVGGIYAKEAYSNGKL